MNLNHLNLEKLISKLERNFTMALNRVISGDYAGKQIVGGMEPAGKFKKKKDNAINRAYNIDEIE